MKYLLLLLIFSSSLFSKDVWLNVKHHIDNQDYIKEEKIYMINGQETKLKRLQYYLTDITFIDMEGNRTPAPNKYVLVDIDSNGVYLGDMDIKAGEYYRIEYKFGIEESVNHGDPSVWPEGHPLHLAYAAMHWGWASGYRFLAIEGFVKDIWNRWLNEFQFHLVGNQYYSSLSNEVFLLEESNGTNNIELNVNVTDILKDVNLTTNNFIHGSGGPNDVIANNIKSGDVIKGVTLSVKDKYPQLSVSPNPSQDYVFVNFENTDIQNLEFKLIDLNGNLISNVYPYLSNKIDISNLSKGIYFINIIENGKTVKTLKMIK